MRLRSARVALLAAIAEQPGRWALLAELGTPGSSSHLASQVRNGVLLPGFESVASGSDVFVRYVGSGLDGLPSDVPTPGAQINWQDPPGGLPVSRDLRIRDERLALLDIIRTEPGRWALFASLGTAASASRLAGRVRHGNFGTGFEARARKLDVYVRYVGDDGHE